jgi:hypothetical protein
LVSGEEKAPGRRLKKKRRKKMKIVKWKLCLPLALMCLFTISSIAYGELYWESLVVTGGVPEGLPKDMPEQVREQILKQFKKKTETARYYLTSHAWRAETTDGIMIMMFDSMTMYQIKPEDKTYMKVDMMSEMDRGMVKDMRKDLRITPTNEYMEIAGYKSRKYYVTTMDFKSEYWVSKEIRGYKEYKAILENALKDNPRLQKMGIFGIPAKEGFPVKTVNKVMGMTTTSTLKKIEKRSLGKDLFKVPEGYTLRETQLPSMKE